MTDTEASTWNLLQAAQRGDGVAADLLFARYREPLLQIVSLDLGRRLSSLIEDEQDIVQDTMLKAIKNLGTFEPRSDGALLHWLAKMAENDLRDALRRGHARKRGDGLVRPISDLSSAFLAATILTSSGPTPSEEAMAEELVERIESMLIQLPEHHRRLFVMRRMCDRSFEEIAEELGFASAASARALYSRILTRLLAQLSAPTGE